MTFQYFFFDTYPGYFLQVLPVSVLACALHLRGRRRKVKSAGGDFRLRDEAWGALFVAYFAGLISLVLAPPHLWTNIWYALFYGGPSGAEITMFTFNYYFVPDFFKHFSAENLGNALAFLPFGVLWPLAERRAGFWRTTLFAFGLSAAVELIQPVLGRAFDVNDIILNTAGAAAGAAAVCAVKKIKNKGEKT